MVGVSEQGDEVVGQASVLSLEQLAVQQHAVAVKDRGELLGQVWESDEELDAFLADLRASRNAWSA